MMISEQDDLKKPENKDILVLGIGNILLGDEGVGVHVITALEKQALPENVTLLDGGTGGFHLLSYLQDYPKVIMIDATLDGQAPGSMSVIRPKFSNEFPRTLSSHDIGLKDLIESASLLDKLPEIVLITITVEPEQSLGIELTDIIKESAKEAVEEVRRLINIPS